MKNKIKVIFKFFIIFIFLFIISVEKVLALDFNVSSDKALLINLNDDSILYEKNSDEKTYIASITKIMTAVLVVENIEDLNKTNKILYEDIMMFAYDAAFSGLKINKSYTYYELLHGLMLESGADCAHALARSVAGDVSKFVNMMNKKAKELGMNNTKFANPTGLDNKNNYSTAKDISKLFKYAIKNETLYKIMSTMKYNVDGIKLKHTILYNLERYNLSLPYLIGGKTGTETKAGYCLATIANYNDIDYMLIVLNSDKAPKHFIDTKNIYEYYMKNYNYYTLIEKNVPLITLNTKYLKQKQIKIKTGKDYSYYLKNDYKDKISYKYDGINLIDNKIKKGDFLGTYSIFYEGQLLSEIPLYLNVDTNFSIINFIIYHKDIFIIITGSVILLGLLLLLVKKRIYSK